MLQLLTSRRAFIYALEVFAQLVAAFALADCLPPEFSVHRQHGERKRQGLGKDAFANGMLRNCLEERLAPHARKVTI